MKKKNKTLITIEIIILLVLILMFAFVMITARNKKIESQKQSTDDRTKEEILIDNIKANFKKGVERVKANQDVSYIPCTDAGVECTKIKKFNIKNVYFITDNKDGKVFRIKYEWSCYDDAVCFYNEQYDSDFNENAMHEASSYYLTDDEGNIKEALGNVYIEEPEENIESEMQSESMEMES